jgi:23S rRNA (adenine2503-C2)-methyltransferase
LLKAKNKFTTTINNIVFMGMGEPLHNLPGILPAIDILLDHHGLHFSHNKVTVSTVGLIPEMKTLLKSCPASLAVSLHGATDAVRGSIVPVNLRYPVEELVSVLREEFPIEANGGSHVLIEYTMMDQVNDSIEDAKALLSLLKGVKCKINLIVFNPHEGTEYRASTPEAVDAFRDILIKGGRVATVRCSRGEDSMAACGQLGEGKRAVSL